MKIVYRILFVLLITMYLFGCGEKTSSIEGKFVDGTGKPLSGISVIFKPVQTTQGYEQIETKTGADGVFRIAGCAPSSEYIISLLSDKWKSKFTKKVKTLEAGQNLVLTQPVKIRFTQMKDGSVIDTKTGMQWKIYPVKDVTAANVLEKVKSLHEGGFSDWRLPSRSDLDSLVDEKQAPKTLSEAISVVKTCCAWVSEPNTKDVDWKFYVEEDNELWSSSKETPDNRIVIVRNYIGVPAPIPAQAPVKAPGSAPAVAPAPAPSVPSVALAPKLPGQTPSKAPETIRNASRDASTEKKDKAAKADQPVMAEKPAVAPQVSATPKISPAAPKTVAPGPAPQSTAPSTTPKATNVASAPKTVAPAQTPANKPAATVASTPTPKVVPPAPSSPAAKASPASALKSDTAKVIDKEPVKKIEVAKVTPAQTASVAMKPASAKKAVSVKKSEPVKVADQDISAEKGLTLYFDSGSSKISPKELVKLKTFFAKVKNNKGTIIINGHSDASANGEGTGNVMLSNERSASVLQALHKMGLSRQIKLEMGALGDSKPAASNDTPDGRKLNRRVEISFVPE